jgi:hypothetical protein
VLFVSCRKIPLRGIQQAGSYILSRMKRCSAAAIA